MNFCRFECRPRGGVYKGDGAFVRPFRGGYYCSSIQISPDAMELMGLEFGDRVNLWWDKKADLIAMENPPPGSGESDVKVSKYLEHGSGKIGSHKLFRAELPPDRKRRELIKVEDGHDGRTLWAFSVAPPKEGC